MRPPGATLGAAAATCSRAPTSCSACRRPMPRCSRGAKPGAWVAACSIRSASAQRVDAYAAAGLEALAMEFMPRITRAQSMDILSSQSNLAGYKAVLDAAAEYGRAFPMMMTAAGHGLGGAGVRDGRRRRRACRRSPPRGGWARRSRRPTCAPRRKEQIQSLGAKPIFVESVAGIEGEGAGGYATEMSRRIQEGAGRAGLQPHRQAGHRHHHRADPGPRRAAADHRRADRDDEARAA